MREAVRSWIDPGEAVRNTSRRFGQSAVYYPAYMDAGPGRDPEPLLFTADQLDLARDRAAANPEDVGPPAPRRGCFARELLALVVGFIVCLFATVACAPQAHAARGLLSDRYDAEIQKAAKLYLPGWRWEWWKAQLYQESKLDPAAVSPAGARGIAQFMPGTWAQEAGRLGFGHLSPHAAEPAILAGAAYMARLRGQWRSERPEDDRRELAQASYNAGLGNILRAQRLCNDARHWPAIQPCLVRVTGPAHSHETTTYVERIRRWYGLLVVRA